MISTLMQNANLLQLQVLMAPPLCVCSCLSVTLERRGRNAFAPQSLFLDEDDTLAVQRNEESENRRAQAVATIVNDACQAIQLVRA